MSFDTVRLALLAALAAFLVLFVVAWALRLRNDRLKGDPEVRRPTLLEMAIGLVTDFFDTLGIGCFAPTTSIYKLKKMVPDENIPGTLNVGHAIPTLAEALIFIAIVQVEPATLLSMIVAAILGSWLGAGVVAKWPRRNVQIGMGIALLVAALLFVAKNVGLMPGDEGTLGLHGGLFWAGIVGNFALGALMTLGIGLYAPCMLLVALLGMSPKAAFPIMMGSCAFLMPIASLRFMAARRYSPGPALGLAIGGVPGVLIAAYIVKELSVTTIRWGVVVVVLYAAVAMLRSAARDRASAPAPELARSA
jgi:uncharacterized membrane protein YfcA